VVSRAENLQESMPPTSPLSPTAVFRRSNIDVTSSITQIPSPTLEDLGPPSADELASRWPGHSEDEIAAIALDYQKECNRLVAMMPLEPVLRRVRELVAMEV